MNVEGWPRVEQICHEALAREPAERADYLDDACAGDADLLREVESLIAQQSAAEGFLETPSLRPGTRLDRYEVTAHLASGGMGEVYEARDTRLGRIVAIKVLPDLATDPRRRRFEHEARAASALNHPHICTLHDIGAEGAVHFLVMERLDGHTLSERLRDGPLPVAQALEYAAQIAAALSAAHEHGIVHRDLKPANIMLTSTGAKLLDFGLAKLKPSGIGTAAGARGGGHDHTSTPGVVLGTLPYMAPEQLAGKETDARTDLFAFGCVLYEMLAGRRPFEGDSDAAIIAAITLSQPPRVASLQPGTPQAVDRLVEHCLQKDPHDRPESARDVAEALGRIAAPVRTSFVTAAVDSRSNLSRLAERESHPPHAPPAMQTHAERLRYVAVTAVLATIALLAIAMWFRKTPAPPSLIQSIAVLPLEDLSGGGSEEYFADGVTDQLIADLGQLAPLRVISRTSIMQYKGARQPLPQIAKKLGVDAVVTATVARSGRRVRITAQLIEARTDRVLWAHAYETDMGDVLALEQELAEVIANEVRGKMSPPEHPVLRRVRSLPGPAQDAYLKGHYLAMTGTVEDLPAAISYFRQSIASESNARAWAAMASTYVTMGHLLFLSPQETFPAAKSAALRALELDDTLEEAHTALGNVKFLYDWDFPGAATEFRLALKSNPSSVRALTAYADYFGAMNRHNEAIEFLRQALEVDPLSLDATQRLAFALYMARRYEEAVAEAKKLVEIAPKFAAAHVPLGLAYEQQRRFSEAIEELRNASGQCRDRCFGLIGQVSAMAGDRQGALEALRQLQGRAYASPWLVAVIYAQLNDKERAFAWLEKAYEGREHDLVLAGEWPVFDNLRADARFRDLLRRIGLPQ